MSEHTTQEEQIRQLRAAAEGRYRQNEYGRYVIDGEPRPERKVREKLMRDGFLTWLFSRYGTALKITSEGEAALRVMEHADA